MAETVQMPKLGFDMAEGTLVRWVKATGEAVNKGEVLAEIETDKATVEVESPYSGVVNQHLVEQGAIVPVGTPIAVITAPGETLDQAMEGKTEPVPQSPTQDTAEVRPVETKAPDAAPAGSAAPGALAATPDYGEGTQHPSVAQQPSTEPETTPADGGDGGFPGGVIASPLARRIAQEKGVDLRQVRGSGPGGRIVRKDVESAQAMPAPAAATPAALAAPAAPTAPAAAPARPAVWLPTGQIPADEPIEMNRLRTAIARRMSESRQQIPDFYVTYVYNVEALLALREQINAQLPEDQPLSVNDFIVKAAALTLREFPGLNASIHGTQIVRKGHVNVGIAVALEAGLMTVVIRDADQKPLRVISSEVRDMVLRARAGKVRTEDIEGSTFSISNLGMYGVEEFVAIINPPEAAILAVGAAQQVPVVGSDGALAVGTRMRATLSADHRITDGAEAARFMRALARYLENPVLLVI